MLKRSRRADRNVAPNVMVRRQAPRSAAFDSRKIHRLATTMLLELGLKDAELSVLLTDDPTIQVLNSQHRDKNRPTDVLAFPQQEPPVRGGLLGDVVLSLDTAARQARGRRRALDAELRFLLAHGLLHLLGHDHHTAAEKRVMDQETRRLIRATTR